MKIKRLLPILQGLHNIDPEAEVTFKVVQADEHAKAQLADDDILSNLDILNIGSYLECHGDDKGNCNCMNIVIDLECNDHQGLHEAASEFDQYIKKCDD